MESLEDQNFEALVALRHRGVDDPKTGKTHHGATFIHDFGKDARAVVQATIFFFGSVYQFAPGTKLAIQEL